MKFPSVIAMPAFVMALGLAGVLVNPPLAEAKGSARVGGCDVSSGVKLKGTALTGTAGPDVIDCRLARRGYTISGLGGADTITGSPYADVINGGEGDDVLRNSAGVDAIDGGLGTDELSFVLATAGVTASPDASSNDGFGSIETYTGIEAVRGSPHDDRLIADARTGSFRERSPGAIIYGESGDDTILGTPEDNRYGLGDDQLDGGPGNDTIDGVAGTDTIAGGDGRDTITMSGFGGRATIDGGEGDDRIDGSRGPDTIAGGPGDDSIRANYGDDSVEGGDGRDAIYGEGGDDVIRGGSGDDYLLGGGGVIDEFIITTDDDTLYGDGGNDELHGDEGIDAVHGGDGTDRLRFLTIGTRRGVHAGTTFALDDGYGNEETYTGIENLSGTVYADILYGDDGPNVLSGDWGDDQIFGGGGDDLLFGSDGDDACYGEDGQDTLLLTDTNPPIDTCEFKDSLELSQIGR